MLDRYGSSLYSDTIKNSLAQRDKTQVLKEGIVLLLGEMTRKVRTRPHIFADLAADRALGPLLAAGDVEPAPGSWCHLR